MATAFQRKPWYSDWNRLIKPVLFLGLVLLTIWRQPELLVHPRFLAEEGRDYFSYAFSHSLRQNFTHPQYGYYTLYHSIITSIATIIPLPSAPLVTTWGAFAVQLVVGYLVLWGDFPLLDSNLKRATLLFSIPLLCFYGASWLDTIGVQYWLCIVTFLLLNEAPAPTGKRHCVPRYLLLALAGLTGVTSCFMTPVFCLKAIRTKSRRFFSYAAILVACCCLQVSVFLQALLNRDPEVGMRFIHNNPVHLVYKVLMFQFAEPFLGHWVFRLSPVADLGAAMKGRAIALLGVTGIGPEIKGMEAVLGACLFIFVMYLCCRTFRDPDYQYIWAPFVLVAACSSLLSLNMSAGPRYTFAPNAMLMFFMTALWSTPRLSISRKMIKTLLVFSLLVHALSFRGSMDLIYNEEWPKWPDEVQNWQNDPSYRLKIWPLGWEMGLSPTPSAR